MDGDRKVKMSISVLDCIQEIKRGSLLDGVGLWEGGRAEEEKEGRSLSFVRRRKEDHPQRRIDGRWELTGSEENGRVEE